MAAKYPGDQPVTYVPPPPPGTAGNPLYPPTGVVMSQPAMGIQTTQVPGSALAYLESIDQLVIRQEIHLSDVIFNFKSNVRFNVVNSQGQPVFVAEEDNDCCTRNFCGSIRPFTMHVKDGSGQTLIVLRRPLRCCGCCFPCCCLQEMTVESPPGRVIGVIKENWNIFTPTFTVEDDGGNELFKIIGNCCPQCTICYCGKDIHFDVTDARTQQNIGVVSKQWSGIMQEAFTNATNFGVSFPLQMPIAQKTILLSVAFLVNFMYFEEDAAQHQNNND